MIAPLVGVLFHLTTEAKVWLHKSDTLQQNMEQVAQAYFEIWTIEVGL